MSPPEGPKLRILIDACLSPVAIPHLRAMFGDAVDAVHVDAMLGPGTTDPEVFSWAARERRLVVTANIGDFARLAGRTKGHAGLALIQDQNTKAAQLEAIGQVVEAVRDWMAFNGQPAGWIFSWRKSGGGRLSARQLP